MTRGSANHSADKRREPTRPPVALEPRPQQSGRRFREVHRMPWIEILPRQEVRVSFHRRRPGSLIGTAFTRTPVNVFSGEGAAKLRNFFRCSGVSSERRILGRKSPRPSRRGSQRRFDETPPQEAGDRDETRFTRPRPPARPSPRLRSPPRWALARGGFDPPRSRPQETFRPPRTGYCGTNRQRPQV